MKTIIILIFALLSMSHILAQEANPNISYNVKYVVDEKGSIYKSEANLQFLLGKLYMNRNNEQKNWTCDYRGIIKRIDGNVVFYYYHYYLPTIRVEMYISKEKEIKHGDKFYYRIIFDGQTQLAL